MSGCLYIATNINSGKVYVGQTTIGLERRKAKHLKDAKGGSKLRFHQAIRKYGEEAFEFKIVVVGPKGTWLSEMETKLISAYGSFGKGYNACEGGPGVRGLKPLIGRKRSAETRAKISVAHKEIWKTRPSPWKGKRHSPETLEKMSAAKRGKTFSEEHRKNLSLAHKGKVHKGTFIKGYKHSEETKKRMSETRKGVPKTGQGLENIRRGIAARFPKKVEA